MKANDFVKKFGWGAAKHKADELKIIESMGDKLSFEDESLKRLVESHELIEKHNGLDNAKSLINHFKFIESERLIPDELEQAVADVESCQ